MSGWLSSLIGGQLAIAGIALIFLLAPDGRLLSRRWRYVAVAPAVGSCCCALALLTVDPDDVRHPDRGRRHRSVACSSASASC